MGGKFLKNCQNSPIRYRPLHFAPGKRHLRRDLAPSKQLDVHVEIQREDTTMRHLLIASAIGLGILSAGSTVRPADAAPFNPVQAEWGVGVTPVQYYRHGYERPYYAPRHYYGTPRYYGPPRHYGYYAPPPPPRYYRHQPRPYYGWR
jgi:hypothetical protein